MNLTFQVVKDAVEKAGYKFFTGNYNLNIIGIRTADLVSNLFNDFICIAYNDGFNDILLTFPATTDPGVYYRSNPCNVKGTAILIPGQHRSVWTIGKHKGKYPALVQHKECTVFRDNNLDDKLDMDGEKDTGLFGINCHHARYDDLTKKVDRWSAGCQVFQFYQHHKILMSLCTVAAKKYGSGFSYTLLTEEDNF